MVEINVIIADINKNKAYTDFYKGEHRFVDKSNEILRDKLKEKFPNLIFHIAYTFEDIHEIIKAENKYIILTNFPANNTYKRYKTDSKDNIVSYLADAYDTTIDNYKILTKSNANIDLYIITGASVELLKDTDVRSISDNHKITIQRKSDWMYQRIEYSVSLENYISNVLEKEIERRNNPFQEN